MDLSLTKDEITLAMQALTAFIILLKVKESSKDELNKYEELLLKFNSILLDNQ